MIAAVVVGAFAGLLAGLLGVGGGVLFVPALTVFLGLSQVDAEATSLLAIMPMALVGAWRQHRYGNVSGRDGGILGARGRPRGDRRRGDRQRRARARRAGRVRGADARHRVADGPPAPQGGDMTDADRRHRPSRQAWRRRRSAATLRRATGTSVPSRMISTAVPLSCARSSTACVRLTRYARWTRAKPLGDHSFSSWLSGVRSRKRPSSQTMRA